jgi:hypothetical protein
MPWYCAWTRNPRYRRWTGRSPSCLCGLGCRNREPVTMNVMEHSWLVYAIRQISVPFVKNGPPIRGRTELNLQSVHGKKRANIRTHVCVGTRFGVFVVVFELGESKDLEAVETKGLPGLPTAR